MAGGGQELHTWKRMLDGQEEVKVEETEWDVEMITATLIRFNEIRSVNIYLIN